MSDLIRRDEVLEALGITDKSTKYGGDHSGYNTLMLYEIMDAIDSIPNAETTGALDDAIQEYIKDGYILAEPNEYVKDGTLTVQMPTMKEAKSIEKVVVYADTYKQEYSLPKVGGVDKN